MGWRLPADRNCRARPRQFFFQTLSTLPDPITLTETAAPNPPLPLAAALIQMAELRSAYFAEIGTTVVTIPPPIAARRTAFTISQNALPNAFLSIFTFISFTFP